MLLGYLMAKGLSLVGSVCLGYLYYVMVWQVQKAASPPSGQDILWFLMHFGIALCSSNKNKEHGTGPPWGSLPKTKHNKNI